MLKILIVDDSEIDRLLMDGLLKRSIGFEVIWADSGRQALQRIEEWNVDLVVTDLQMPEMDGLELVQQVRQIYPELPVILTTAVGSEQIAAKALSQGAAGYVPKSLLSKLLVPTVRNALNLLNKQRDYDQLLSQAKVAQFSFTLENNPAHFPALVDFCGKLLRGMVKLDRIERLRTGIAIEHALHNALYRGNLELGGEYPIPLDGTELDKNVARVVRDRMKEAPYKDRKIRVAVKIKKSSISIGIRDEGPGFKSEQEGDWSQDSSRGIILMKAFMDEVVYNRRGNEVVIKRRLGKRPTRKKRRRISDNSSPPKPKLLGKLNCNKTGKEVSMTVDKFMLGRQKGCHLVIPFQSVAANHCLLIYEDGAWYAKDMSNESQGTLINGKPIEYNRIESGDQLTVGSYDYHIEY